jgi:cysteine synthase
VPNPNLTIRHFFVAVSPPAGVALALVAASRGYRCVLAVPDDVGEETLQLLATLGAEVRMPYSDAKVANRDIRIWHATENGH